MALIKRHIGAVLAAVAVVVCAVALVAPYISARAAYGELQEKCTNSLGVDFDALAAQNPDVVGWICVTDTCIDYPVVQGEGEEYLNLAFDGTQSKAGTPFLDALNASDFSDKVSFIYGHSLLDGSMFSSVPNYTSKSFFDAHQDITLVTPAHEMSLTPWAALRVSGSDGTLHVGSFETADAWESYKDYVEHYALVLGSQDKESIEQLVCLVACSYNSINERTLVFCTID